MFTFDKQNDKKYSQISDSSYIIVYFVIILVCSNIGYTN